jgi:DMSO/TMAO reductase YedYZ heme-binding membrane subunit
VIHYVWLVKKDLTKPLEYAAVVTVLLGYRLAVWAIPLVSSKRLLSGKPVAVEESQA